MSWQTWVVFAIFCLLWGSGWLLDFYLPGRWSGWVDLAAHLLVMAVVCGVVSAIRRRDAPVGRRVWLELTVGSVFLGAVPRLVLTGASKTVSEYTCEMVFLLVPVVVVFLAGQGAVDFGATENPLRKLLPALVGLGGATLLLPFSWPHSTEARVWLSMLALSAALAGYAAIRLHRALATVGFIAATAVMSAASGLSMLAFSYGQWSRGPSWTWPLIGVEVIRCFGFDAPAMLLTVWLLRRMDPIAYSARYLLVLLVGIVESLVLMRPSMVWTGWLGLLLILGGSLALLRTDSPKVL
jgi:drug/metabolite transporter (DMT)-like permease